MIRQFIIKLSHSILVLVLLTFSLGAQAQDAEGGADLDGLVSDTKNDLLIVIGGGLAGAILGLSTLSFVEEPKEHTRNIVVGASVGIIAGVGYVAFSQANKTQDLLYGDEEGDEEASIQFNTRDRASWHASNNIVEPIVTPYSLGMSFKF